MKIFTKFLLVAFISLFVFGCELSFLEEEKKGSSKSVSEVVVGDSKIYIPGEFQTVDAPEGNFEGVVVSMDNDEVVGFAAVVGSSRGLVEDNILNKDSTTIRNALGVSSFSLVGSSKTDEISTERYMLEMNYNFVPGDVANYLMELIGKSSDFGSLSNLTQDYSGTFSDTFRVIMTVKQLDNGSIVKTVAVTTEEKYEENRAAIEAFVDGTNIGSEDSERVSSLTTFVAEGGSNKADFLFVVDNSGSMSEEQAAVIDAANVFWDKLALSGLDFEVGVITTDSDTLKGNGFTTNEEQFKSDVDCGTWGSGTETGIYYSEKALGVNGTVTNAGYPRRDASLSVILLSDEPSQYTSRGNGSFNPDNNLFIDNGYRFYSIIDLEQNDSSQYDDLSVSTGGSIASIKDTTVFSAIMDTIAVNSSAAASQFTLNDTNVISGTIVVKVNGSTIPRSTTDGFEYNSGINSIVFYGDAVPQAGDSVKVTYDTIQ